MLRYLTLAAVACVVLAFPAAPLGADSQPSLKCVSLSTSGGVGNDCKAAVNVNCAAGGQCFGMATVWVNCVGCSPGFVNLVRSGFAGSAAWYKPDLSCGTNCAIGQSRAYTVQQMVLVQHAATYRNVTTYRTVCTVRLGRASCTLQPTTTQVLDRAAWTERQIVNVTRYTCAARMAAVVIPDPTGKAAYGVTVDLWLNCPNDGGSASASVEANKAVLAALGFNISG
jgi:hypothetical protein